MIEGEGGGAVWDAIAKRQKEQRMRHDVWDANRKLEEAREEILALRRELAARRAVDGWLDEDPLRRLSRHMDHLYADECSGRDYPALATALGLEWEEKTE